MRSLRSIGQAVYEWIDERLIDPHRSGPPSADELSQGVAAHMIPATAAHWEQTVQSALAGDEDAIAEVRVMRFYALDAPSLTLPTGRGEAVL